MAIAGFVLLLAHWSANLTVYAQELSTQNANQEILPGYGELQYEIWRDGEIVAEKTANPDQVINVIIRFEQPPLMGGDVAPAKQASRSDQYQIIQIDHNRINEDLLRLSEATETNTSKMSVQAEVGHHFVNAFNGVSASLPQWMIKRVLALDYVRAVHIDGEMHATGFEPPKSQIRKNQSGYTLDGTGAGTRIAVIDTGIDYTHTTLGAGFGNGFKVVDGYDFVNEDSDPLDDNGHGTHVAGIIAGEGESWHGVAPEASLLAYKVLDEDGSGWDSWVLAAIERALDPDNNPLTDDTVDAINLSLGSGAGSDTQHPVTLAVEHAIRAGVVCVVAAGNAGHLGKASIAAPGNALSAITVGAATEDGRVAAFSAQGPTGSIQTTSKPRFGIKPDIFAPGVNVNSTWLNGEFKKMDGTSMATPHIAGLVARILQLHPDWSPDQVKSALVQFADPDGFMPWLLHDEEAGTLPAQELRTLVTPSRFDFGLIEAETDMWTYTDSMTIHNFDDVPKSFNMAAVGDLPAGVQIDFETPSISIAGGTHQVVPFVFTGSYSALPKRDFPDAFLGEIIVSSEGMVHTTPFSFFNPGQARLSMPEPADILFLLGQDAGHEYTFFDPQGNLYLFLPEDKYDAIAQFDGGNYVVIKEDVFHSSSIESEITKGDAIFKMTLAPKDKRQAGIANVSGMHAITHKETGYSVVRQGGFLSMASQLPSIQHFSEFSDAYKIEIKAAGFSQEGDYYEIPFKVNDGLSSDLLLENDPARFTQINYNYAIPGETQKLFFVPWTYHINAAGRRPTIGAKLDVSEDSPFIVRPPFKKTVFLAPAPDTSFRWQGHFHTLHSEDFSLYKLATSASQITVVETDEVHVDATQQVSVGYDGVLQMDGRQPLDLYPGAGTIHWAGTMNNSPTQIRVKEGPSGGFFINEWGDLNPRSFSMKLFSDNKLIFSDSLFNVPNLPVGRWLGESQVDVEAGAYRMVVEDGFSTSQAWASKAVAELAFRTNLADSNPPRITQFYVESEGRPQRVLHPNRSHKVVLGVEEVCSWCSSDTEPAFLQIQVRDMQDSLWIELDAERVGKYYHATLPGGLEESHYEARVIAEDESENQLTYTVSPAFELGVSRVPLLLEPTAGSIEVSPSPELAWSKIDGALSYHLQIAAQESFDTVLFESNERVETHQSLPMLDKGQRYYWRVRAKTEQGFMPWSQPFWFDTIASVGADAGHAVPDDFEMKQVYPNPVIDMATVQFSVPEPARVKIELFDMLGRRIQIIEDDMWPAGRHLRSFDASGLASGAYLIRLQSQTFTATQKFVHR